MKTARWIIIISVFLLLFSNTAHSQKKILTDEEEISEIVIKEIDAVFHSDEFIKKKNKKFKEVRGTLTIDVGIIQNGKVSTFFKVESDINNADFIDFISEYILNHKFYFKLQKHQRYKIRFSITF